MSTIGTDVVNRTLETKINVKQLKIFQMTLSKNRKWKKNEEGKGWMGRSRNVNSQEKKYYRNFSHVIPISLTRTCKCVGIKTITNTRTKCQTSMEQRQSEEKCTRPNNKANKHISKKWQQLDGTINFVLLSTPDFLDKYQLHNVRVCVPFG